MIEKYRPEYKDLCVDLVIDKQYTLRAAATKMNIPTSSLSDWVQLHKNDNKRPKPIRLTPDQVYNQQLEEDILQLTKVNLSLKKRCAFLLTEKNNCSK